MTDTVTLAGETYAAAVVAREIVAGPFVRAACARHLADLEDGPARGLHFDRAAALRAVRFFRFLRHYKGEWAGLEIALEPWQAFILESLFGWKRTDGTRRFRIGYVEIARKNGKSTLGAGVALYCLVADGEPGAEVYAAATTKDQARIVWSAGESMVKASPHLAARISTFRHNLSVLETQSKFEPLSSDFNTLDGLNTHCAIVDELHAHASRDLWDVIETSTPSRRSPLMFGITTAGQDPLSLCGELHEIAKSVATRAHEDDAFFGYVASLDKGDDWTDPAVWAKANPNLGVSVKPTYLSEKIDRARHAPASASAVRRLHFNEWLAATESFLPIERWQACAGPVPALEMRAHLAGRELFAGVDLASKVDLASIAFVSEDPEEPETWDVWVHHYMPEERARDPEAIRRDRVPWDLWCDAGWITATPGSVIDYDVLLADLLAVGRECKMIEVGFDPWNAAHFVDQLENVHGFTMVPVRQGFASMNAPTKYLLDRVVSGRLRHGANPVLDWQAGHFAVATDPAENVKPDKRRSRLKIDGLVALINALDRAYRHRAGETPSVYRSRGFATT